MASESEHVLHVKVKPDMSEIDAMMQTPSVGRIVHYVSYGTPIQPDGSQAYESQCRAAIVTEVPPPGSYSRWAGTEPQEFDIQPLGLAVLNPSGMFFCDAPQDEDEHAGGTWHWPERV